MMYEMHRRTQYLIKKRFQLKYTIAMALMFTTIMATTGVGMYLGLWSSIIENFSQFKVSENMETAKRIAGYEEARYGKGDFRLEKIFREAELLSAKEQETLHSALRSVNRSLAPKVVILIGVLFIASILISHSIAGPMHRFEKSAQAIRDGDLSVNFNIRKTDEMKDAAFSLEEMVESLRKDMKAMKGLAEVGKVEEIKTILSKYKI